MQRNMPECLLLSSCRDGALNDPIKGSRGWEIEICIPLAQYVRYENRSRAPPRAGDRWRINFSRVEWHVYTHTLPNGTQVYWKNQSVPAENWVWQPMGVVDM